MFRRLGVPGTAGVLALLALAAPAAGGGRGAAALRMTLEEGGLASYAEGLDDLLWEDAVAGLTDAERPPRPPLPLDILRSSLDTSTAILALCPLGDAVFALVVRREGLVARELDAPQTAVMSARMRRWAESPSEHPYDPHAAVMLHNGLFPPLRRDLAGIRRLIVAASGPLAGLPFEAFLTFPEEDADPTARMYLGRAVEISYEATLGSRLGWSARRTELRRVPPPDGRRPLDFGEAPLSPGSWVVAAAAAGADLRVISLRILRAGARGALLAPSPEVLDGLLPLVIRESAAGRRPDAVAVRRARMAAMAKGAAPETWALASLWGSR